VELPIPYRFAKLEASGFREEVGHNFLNAGTPLEHLD